MQFFQKAAPLDVPVFHPVFEFVNPGFHPFNRSGDLGVEGYCKAILFLGGITMELVRIVLVLNRFPAAGIKFTRPGFCIPDIFYFGGYMTLTTDYVRRGVSQCDGSPVLQLEADFSIKNGL